MTKPVPKVKIQKENEITVNSLVAKLEDHEPFLSAFGRVKTQRIGNLSFGVSEKYVFEPIIIPCSSHLHLCTSCLEYLFEIQNGLSLFFCAGEINPS